jgi:hypothetical protein
MDERQSFRPDSQQAAPRTRPTTAPHGGKPIGQRVVTPQQSPVPSKSNKPSPSQAGHQRFVLNDPVAFRYLEEDPSTTVLERRSTLEGYECYIVEQWTTSRTHPTFVITTYTGIPAHTIVVGVLSVPTDESNWSPRLRVYFKALNQYHARRRETPLGILMVTNLSAFPSSLSVIPVPGGDLNKHRYDFFVNENLKRLGCSGRVGLTLTQPNAATIAKFHQLYRTSDKNEIYKSVVELVKLCQSALMLFNKLDIDYADGLLCDVTERAINDWWVEIGSEYYSIEPHDGILGPTTVAALLGLLMGARSRLHAVSAPVGKDAFDVESMKHGIGAFQKQQRITRSRRFDRHTLHRLHKASSKAASSESWSVPRVVKSTMAELSGKGGEMVMDAVGIRDRAAIADIETTDLDRFVQLVYGERCKWLFYGKPYKKVKATATGDASKDANASLVFKPDEHGGFTWTGRKSTVDGMPVLSREQYDDLASPVHQDGDTTDEEGHKRGLFKRATGIKNEAKSGFGKIKGVVGMKGHAQKSAHAQDENLDSPIDSVSAQPDRPTVQGLPTSPRSSTQEQTLAPLRWDVNDHVTWSTRRPETIEEASRASRENLAETAADGDALHDGQGIHDSIELDKASTVVSEVHRPSITETLYHGVELDEALPTGPHTEHDIDLTLRRTLSYNYIVTTQQDIAVNQHYPRHLSFSLAEDTVLTWQSLVQEPGDDSDDEPLAVQMAEQNIYAKTAINLRVALSAVSSEMADWTTSQINQLRQLLPLAEQNAERLSHMYRPHLDSLRSIQTNTETMLREERDMLAEGGKELETLAAKLEYEINALKDRVDDVESGVGDFERSVARVEDRVTELEKDGHGSSSSCILQ